MSSHVIIDNNYTITLPPYFSITHHIDGIYRPDAVDKHVCVDHCWFDCKNSTENTF